MSTQVERRRPQTPEDVEAEVQGAMEWFAKVAPAHVNPEQFVALALGQISRDRDLMAAAIMNPGSLMVALVECARLGLVVGVTYHLTHFKNRTTNVPEIVGIVDYKGEIEMIYRAGGVSAVHGQVVRGGPEAAKPDHFDWRPGMTLPEHVIADGGLADESERGPLRGVYAYATLLTGGYSAPVVMPKSEVMRHKAAAKTMKFWEGPWEPAMWLKTAFHALYDRVPHSPEYLTEMVRASAAAAQLPLNVPPGPALSRGFSGRPPITTADLRRPEGQQSAAVTGRRRRDAAQASPPGGLKALHEHLLAMDIGDQDREPALAALGMLLRPGNEGPPVPVQSLQELDGEQLETLNRKLRVIRQQAQRADRKARDDMLQLAAAAQALLSQTAS